MPPRTLVLGDLHLIPESSRDVSDDLASLLAAHPGARIAVAGDLFDLAAVTPRRPADEAVKNALEAHPKARAALGKHLEGGGELWLLGGNHDAALTLASTQAAFTEALAISHEAKARVRTSPWFLRAGGLHIEHGHLFDPDNAPAHPLIVGAQSLGVHFTEEFIAPTGAHRYLQANDGTPLKLFLASFTWYGRRAPYVIYRYFHAALGALLKSGPLYRATDEVPKGRDDAARFAEEVGVPHAMAEELFALGATPTLESLSRTFTRLYFDRVLATLSLGFGVGALAGGAIPAAATLLGVGTLLMGASWAVGHNRYTGAVTDRLAEGARRVAEVTDAKLVIFGHTHREALDGAYANTGSFAFPRGAPGRPFLEIEGSDSAPRAVRRYWG